MKRSRTNKQATKSETPAPWADRPNFSELCWNGNNLELNTTVPKPGSLESPATDDAAVYTYGVAIGKECAQDYYRAFDGNETESSDLSDTVCNLLQDPTRNEIEKRGAVAGFLDELAVFTHRGMKEILHTETHVRGYLALFGTRGFSFDILDDRHVIAEHLEVLTKAHHALSRLVRTGAAAEDVFDDDVDSAQDGLEFLSAMAAILAKHAAADL